MSLMVKESDVNWKLIDDNGDELIVGDKHVHCGCGYFIEKIIPERGRVVVAPEDEGGEQYTHPVSDLGLRLIPDHLEGKVVYTITEYEGTKYIYHIIAQHGAFTVKRSPKTDKMYVLWAHGVITEAYDGQHMGFRSQCFAQPKQFTTEQEALHVIVTDIESQTVDC